MKATTIGVRFSFIVDCQLLHLRCVLQLISFESMLYCCGKNKWLFAMTCRLLFR